MIAEWAIAIPLLLLVFLAGAYRALAYSPASVEPKLGAVLREGKLRVGERERTYLAYLPAQLPPGAPLMFVLHGSAGDGRKIRACTGFEFDQLADARGFAVVYPDGYEGNWNDCRRAAKYPARAENIDDVGFIKGLIARFASEHGIATDQVYAFGYSNGAQMAFRIALDEPDLLAGIAAVCANLPVPENNLSAQEGPTPRAMLISGTEDPINPFSGGEATLFGFNSRGFVISADATAEELARRNRLVGPPLVEPLAHRSASDKTSVERRVWKRNGEPYLMQIVVKRGGHVVPQKAFRFPRIFGRTTGDLDAPLAAVEFFLKV